MLADPMRPSLLALAACLCACTTSPVAPIPQPLPETLAWAAAGSAGGGAYLGLKTRENVGRSFEDLDAAAGVRVSRVVENSPAAEAGFRVADVVLAFDGHRTDDPETLDALVEATAPRTGVELTVQRGDTVFAVPVLLGAATGGNDAEVTVQHRLDPARSRAAWLTGRGGVVLVSSDEAGPFPRAGVPVGSVVEAVDGQRVVSDRELIRALTSRPPGAEVEVAFVDPSGARRTRTVELRDQETRVTRVSLPVLFGYSADVEGEETHVVLVDLWFISLFRYERQGKERHWSFLRFFRFATGVGELDR